MSDIEFGFCTACNQRTPANAATRCFLCGCPHEPEDEWGDDDEHGTEVQP